MMNDSQITSVLAIALGFILILLGVGAYVLSEFASVTALIPAVFGMIFLLLGVIGHGPERQRLANTGIGLLAVLGILGSARGIPDMLALVTGQPVDSLLAVASQGAMIVISLVLLSGSVKYLLNVR